MQLTLITIGQPRSKATRSLINEYSERLQHYARFSHVMLPDRQKGSLDDIRAQQSGALLAAVPNRAKIVVLDERGAAWSSTKLASLMEQDALYGESHWALLIGGADGHTTALRNQADLLWSLSPLTLPHDLATIVVVEQLYRAMTIQRGEPYHRGN